MSREAQSKIQHPNLKIFASTLLIACPGLTQEMLDYEIQVIRAHPSYPWLVPLQPGSACSLLITESFCT